MKKDTKRLIGAVALALGAMGATGAALRKKNSLRRKHTDKTKAGDVWARPGMSVTFRAEVMPGRETSERTFRVAQLLHSGRVTLQGVAGEHAETEFERIR